jgi:cephalosporin-C deacetylase-like acetyl esterase
MKPARGSLCFLLACVSAAAQDDAAYRRMLESKQSVTEYLNRRAREITDRAGREVSSPESWEKVNVARRDELRDMLGLLPWPTRTPLNARITGTIDRGDFVIEKIAFESLPKFYVTGNLYLPKNRKGPAPGIIYVCGHSESPYGAKAQYQRHGISFAKNGYAAFVIDPIQIAEIYSPHHGVVFEEMYDWYSRGYTPAGVETWNAIRAIDYLETRPEVDKNRIGITGRSGGAAMSWFTGAVDPRVKVVVPIMGISTYAANMEANTQALHCDCMFPINFYRQDMMHQAGLIAPRPLLFGEGKKDALFPVPGYMEVLDKVSSLYRGYGKPDAFRLVEVDTAHADSDYLREQAIRWFDKYLMGVPERKLDMAYVNTPDEQLAVFAGKPPADAQNGNVWASFTTRPRSGEFKTLDAWKKRSGELTAQLHRKVFGAMPAALHNVQLSATATPPRRVGRFIEMQLRSDETVPVRLLLRTSTQKAAESGVLLYIASDGEDVTYIDNLFRGLNAPESLLWMVVFPRGIGEVAWDKTFWKGTLRNAMQVGETVDSMRLTDVIAAIDLLASRDDVDTSRIAIAGRGVQGAIGLYAALFRPDVGHVILIDPPTSHAEGPIFLNVMRYTDLPEAAGLFAPRRLTFWGTTPVAFEYSRHVWKLYGKAENLGSTVRIEWGQR